ncbi:MAG: WxcM-like domain-containing protein, partial [Candidatus Cloacimonadales bacterium]|nr:WxcM-like domain-containing protein [Candidatus Cloacimonadales bacterium]
KKTITLNRPNVGLIIVPGIWRELINFSGSAVCLVLASNNYLEEDYIRDFTFFLQLKKDKI